MKFSSRSLFLLLLGSALLAPAWAASAAPATIELVVPNYDYPPTGNPATGFGIANNGTVVGKSGAGNFLRYANGNFSPLFNYPGATVTLALGVNSSNVACGYYTSATAFHGFFYDGGTFTSYDVPGSTFTIVSGLSDGGDFCGYYAVGTGAPYVGFLNVGDVAVSFTVPGAIATRARGINNLGQVVGDYDNPDGSVHGFLREADGTLTYPINAGPTDTQINGINDNGIMAGYYANGKGIHGFVLMLPRGLVSFDYPDDGTILTELNGINNSGYVTGIDNTIQVEFTFIGRLAR